jgi:hypothetical protein
MHFIMLHLMGRLIALLVLDQAENALQGQTLNLPSNEEKKSLLS